MTLNDKNKDLKDLELLHKREAMYNLQEMNKTYNILTYSRIILYILVGILVIFLLYNIFLSTNSFVKNLIV
jgi:hypothetical protein